MMQRKLSVSIALAGLFFVGACDNLMRAGLGCDVIRNTVQSTSADTVTTTTGLRFIEERVGTGHAVQSCREATVRYTGFVFEGDQFDHRTITAVPGTGQLIPGFEQGMVGISTGGLRRVIIPPHLGYGGIARLNTAGDTIIPANATLIFDLEVLAASN